MPEQMAAEQECYATVRIETTMHVKLKAPGTHPDLVDWEAVALKLDEQIAEGGAVPEDVEVTYLSLSSETEPWT